MNLSRIKPIAIIVICGLAFNSCSYHVLPPSVKTRTEIKYPYKNGYRTSMWRRVGTTTEHRHYDKKGNVIEEGEYGEIWHYKNVSQDADSSINITSGHGRDYRKLNTVHYYYYDSLSRKISDELWQFSNNRKRRLIYRTRFEYNLNGKLIKEKEADEHYKISRVKDYFQSADNKTVSNDSVFHYLYEGITRVDGKSQDTITTDSLGRPVEIIHYYNNKFLYRKEYRYDRWGDVVTELTYDDKPDSLWSITEWQYDYSKRPIRKLWKVVGTTTETRDIYIYNRRKLLSKILHYDREKLVGYTKYKYKLY
jgi:hypothetical protein